MRHACALSHQRDLPNKTVDVSIHPLSQPPQPLTHRCCEVTTIDGKCVLRAATRSPHRLDSTTRGWAGSPASIAGGDSATPHTGKDSPRERTRGVGSLRSAARRAVLSLAFPAGRIHCASPSGALSPHGCGRVSFRTQRRRIVDGDGCDVSTGRDIECSTSFGSRCVRRRADAAPMTGVASCEGRAGAATAALDTACRR